MDIATLPNKTSSNPKRGGDLVVPSSMEGATSGYKGEGVESEATQWKQSTDERVFVDLSDAAAGDRYAFTTTTESTQDTARLVETHEFIIAGIVGAKATMEFSIGTESKKFIAVLTGLEDIGVIAPSVGDRFKLDIFKTANGLISRATKISSAGGLAFPEVAPPFDPAYLDYFKKQLRKDE